MLLVSGEGLLHACISSFYFKSCLYGFTQSIMSGIDLYNKNTFSAWHVSGYSTLLQIGLKTAQKIKKTPRRSGCIRKRHFYSSNKGSLKQNSIRKKAKIMQYINRYYM